MKYHIETKGSRIASFEHKEDRDICIDALREYWEDCDFTDFNEE